MADKDQTNETEKQKEGEEDKPRTWRGRLAAWLVDAQFVAYTTLLVVLLILGFVWNRMFVTIQPGHHGVMYRFFAGGTVTDRIWGEGLQIIPPWDKLTIYETRLQQQTLKFDVLSEEGLNLGVETSVRYRPRQDMLGFLHQDIGTDYFERIVKPEVQAHVRRVFGGRPAQEIYSSARDILQELGRVPELGRVEDTDAGLASRPYVQIQELKLLDVKLPAIVETAIADKYRQEQLMLEYRYKLEREEKEAERKRTEAAGIRDYNLIAARISPDLLRWKGVDATLELAKSPNTKVVVLGGGQGSTPVLLNLVDAPSNPSGSNPAADPSAADQAGSATSSTGSNPTASAQNSTGAVVVPQGPAPQAQEVQGGALAPPKNASELANPGARPAQQPGQGNTPGGGPAPQSYPAP
ncbi:prohibitin family protein [Chondromyces apiculatus]|uniref:Band 7 domain-containing protein n=1 Tax=Chondromyces apiculatus DSM 436 TaxID=1192034 RepID=A0A017T554_9BACT|nr:prohibitin family protein [Chondromyces apiculatus]EYF04403.1 Hypothetical protein CAP_4542 [Chondromyces apiculatus DSM 436]